MPAEMKLPKTLTENSISERFSQLSQIYTGISGQIYKSDVERHHKALYGLSYSAALGFGLLALFKGPWFGYAFYTGLIVSLALIITASNGRNKRRREGQTQPGVN
jgi:hypothetical protein